MVNDILSKIIANKRKEVASRKETLPLVELLNNYASQFERTTFTMLGMLQKSSTGIIAEFKRKSPSKGWIHPNARIEDILPAYNLGGATAASILTDEVFFGGNLDDLSQARKIVWMPLLRKDFIVDEYQIYESRAAGADAILLIASALSQQECLQFARKAHELNLEVLLEIHSEDEFDHLNKYVDMLGVNNRNLGTFDTSVQNSFRLLDKIKDKMWKKSCNALFVSESGLADVATIRELRRAGFQGFLIGEMFMKTADPGKTLKDLINQLEYEE